MKHIRKKNNLEDAKYQGLCLNVGDIVLVHRSPRNVVCIVTRCEDISCARCALNNCGCLFYKGEIGSTGPFLGFLPVEDAVE